MDNIERNIYSIYGNAPEISAYGLAKYSRSSMSLADSLKELSQQKTEEFLNTFYFQYGHSSIADLAHVSIALENISIWAAMVVADEPLWDGQERSTRYQDFKKTKYFTPDGAPGSYRELSDEMFLRYDELTQTLQSALASKYPKPDDMTEEYYQRTLRARAFDVSRYWLPLSTNTSLGQITSARTLERQISRLMSHDVPEIRQIAAEMREAVVSREPVQPNGDSASDVRRTGPLLPTLAKYTSPNTYTINSRLKLKQAARELIGHLQPRAGKPVELSLFQDPLEHACTALLYSVSHLSYKQLQEVVQNLSTAQKHDLLETAFADRGKHDAWLRELQSHPLIFDVTMDIGAFRDLNRHRKVSKIVQDLGTHLGYSTPDILHETGMAQDYRQLMDNHFQTVSRLQEEWNPVEALYLLPMAANCRSLHQMDLHQAAYLIELRTGSAGHFSYREIAYQMFEELERQYPDFTKYIRVTNPREVFNPFQR
ncbi:FAD-dependent thymidylate synthase [Tumebacillus flagellatus]|uniref:Alternative thymidylate synthase n=1 Tax=Tumebacillus flagellatus TaxID=1157490 RepID=A0A074M4M6_9BACL|nr:FAD-dependent thymidylate synthase [Tumebacillus flagellatus]KEO80962.1 hypothetical protein EL26_23320 [Tumebacillus flagellatus]